MKKKNQHYTDADTALAEEIRNDLRTNRITQTALGIAANVAESTVSNLLIGTYNAPPAEKLAGLRSALTTLIGQIPGDGPPNVETSLFRLVCMAGTKARVSGMISVVTAAVGTGKTTAIRAAWPSGVTLVVDSNPQMNVNSFLSALERGLRVETRGTPADRHQRVVDVLTGSTALIVIDEAETLKPRVLETARRIRDVAEVGLLLVGTERLRTMLTPEAGVFGQIRSRATFWPAHVSEIGDEDVNLLISNYLPEADEPTKTALREISGGSARMLREGLIRNVRNWTRANPNQKISATLVRSIAQQAMSLT